MVFELYLILLVEVSAFCCHYFVEALFFWYELVFFLQYVLELLIV